MEKGQKFKSYHLLNFLWLKNPIKDWKSNYLDYTISWCTNDYAMEDWFVVKNKDDDDIIDSIFDYVIIKDITDDYVVIENFQDEDDYKEEQMNIKKQDFLEYLNTI